MEVVATTPDGPAQVSLSFNVPDIEPGHYQVVYCNQPCTDGLGDLMGGYIELRQRLAPGLTPTDRATTSEHSSSGRWSVPAAAVLAALGTVTLYTRRHRHPSREHALGHRRHATER
jgi:hypothetical protein